MSPARSAQPIAAVLIAIAVSCSGGRFRTEPAPPRSVLPLLPKPATNGRFEGTFDSRLRAADPARRFVALVDLTDQLDLRAFARRLAMSQRRADVVAALEAVAVRQQARLRPLLDSLQAEGSITSVRPVAIVNRLVVTGTPDGILALARSSEVAVVRPDWTSERSATRAGSEPASAPVFPSWAIGATKADRLWRLGLDGTGVVVASIDTGVFEAHEQLQGRRMAGERGWFDPYDGTTEPVDTHGHGTGVLSQAVGGNPEGRAIGIAPGARWASALGNRKNFYARSTMTLAADWVLRVSRPHVLVNAWSHEEGDCNEFDRPFIDAWKASGIFVVFPAGNGGPAPATGESPAELRGVFPEGGSVFSVGALARSGSALPLSSRGPSRCGSVDFPTLAAPGEELPIASPDGPRDYASGDGTSLSAGIVGGAAALLLQAAPETDPETLARVLVESSRDVLPSGRDDATGAGAIDCEAALALLRRPSVE